MRGRIAATAIAALLVGATMINPDPALAACVSNRLCLFQDNNHGGGRYIVTGTNYTYHDGDTFDNGFHLYDAASSYQNNTQSHWMLWSNHFLSGYGWCVFPGESRSSMIGFNDVASSNDFGCS
jgi:hypothetical protein